MSVHSTSFLSSVALYVFSLFLSLFQPPSLLLLSLASSKWLTPLNQSSGKGPKYLSFFPHLSQHAATPTLNWAHWTYYHRTCHPSAYNFSSSSHHSSLYLFSSAPPTTAASSFPSSSPLSYSVSPSGPHLRSHFSRSSVWTGNKKHWDEKYIWLKLGRWTLTKYSLHLFVSSNRHQFERLFKCTGGGKNWQFFFVMFIK